MLESVSNLTVTPINSTTVLISWSPPFTLEGVLILGYNITFFINGEYEATLIEKDSSMLYYSFGQLLLENDLVVTVIPINGGGSGTGKSTIFSFNNSKSHYVLYNHINALIIIMLLASSVIKASSEHYQSTSYMYTSVTLKMSSSANACKWHMNMNLIANQF